MAIKEIRRAFEYSCDGCPVTHIQHNAEGHYFQSLPPGWSSLRFIRKEGGDGHQLQTDMKDVLLCERCGEKIADAIKKVVTV